MTDRLLAALKTAGRYIKAWAAPIIGAVLLVLAVNGARRARHRAERADRKLDDALAHEGEVFRRDIDKTRERAEKAQKRAKAARRRAEDRRDQLAKHSPDMADLLDEYRSNQRMRDSTDSP